MITERLFLDPITLQDNVFMLELVNSEGWLTFIGDRQVHSPEAATAYIQKMLNNSLGEYWVVRTKNEKIPVGVVTWIKREYLDHHDLGFAFLPAFAGKGYAHEASKAVLEYLLRNREPAQVLATTLPNNTSSIRLLEKLGFSFEKEITVENEKLSLYALQAH